MNRVSLIILILSLVLFSSVYSSENIPLETEGIVDAILFLRNPDTKLPPSHWNHPGYKDLAFLYDEAVSALILKASGHQKEAEEILDYFTRRLRIPLEELNKRADTNGIYGILKLLKPKGHPERPVKAIINALDITSNIRQGRGTLEFWSTPGPISFLIFAMLGVNREKYYHDALTLGEALLAMQDVEGGVHDGDRAPAKIHTEPHLDAYAAFLMLYEVSGEQRWKIAGERAFEWFKEKVYHPQKSSVDQGVWLDSASTIFATDCYSWTMSGPVGDRLELILLKKLTETMLSRSLVKVNLSLPEGKNLSAILCDFSDPQDSRIKDVRTGFHPLGSVEWTGGVILALQKNAVRFWKAKDTQTAKFYKAIAEILFKETMKCFYSPKGLAGKITFYATGQGVEVGPFGSIEERLASGWKSPYFYVKDKSGRIKIEGGSTTGAWPLLPYYGLNPFILDDPYRVLYNQITLTAEDLNQARTFLEDMAATRTFYETIPQEMPQAEEQIVEPGEFNKNMWQAFELAYAAKERGNTLEAKKYFQRAIWWAEKTVDNPTWVMLAKRDEIQKEKEFGGIIAYPWGITYPDNNHPLHFAIWRYPLLNEMAAAMWGLATANFELGNTQEAKKWITRIIEEIPLHQIAAVKKDKNNKNVLIQGYWNAIVSWEDNPSGLERDEKLGLLYREVLREKGLNSAKPKIVLPIDLSESKDQHF